MQTVQPISCPNICSGLKHVADNVVDGPRHVLDVLFAHCTPRSVSHQSYRVEILTATDGGTTGLEQVDVVFVLESIDLFGGKTGIGEHSILYLISK